MSRKTPLAKSVFGGSIRVRAARSRCGHTASVLHSTRNRLPCSSHQNCQHQQYQCHRYDYHTLHNNHPVHPAHTRNINRFRDDDDGSGVGSGGRCFRHASSLTTAAHEPLLASASSSMSPAPKSAPRSSAAVRVQHQQGVDGNKAETTVASVSGLDTETVSATMAQAKTGSGSAGTTTKEQPTTATTTTTTTTTLVQDAQLNFENVMKRLEEKFGKQNLCFPKEIYWLVGAPGSGKGTMCKYIMGERGLTSDPIVVSDLLQSPEMKTLKDKGLLISDEEVIELLFSKLLDQENYENGVIVDGFPRTKVQAECIALLYDRMHALRKEFQGTKFSDRFRRPKFRLCVLYVDEKTSIERQLARGKQIREHNRLVRETGIGELYEERETDLSAEAAQRRYSYFIENIFESIKLLKSRFHYNFIDASGSIEQVAQNIIDEMKYQSSMELARETFDALSVITPAEELTRHPRQQLIQKLDSYQTRYTTLFNQVLEVIQTEFMHILYRQALSGVAVIRSEHEVFMQSNLAVNMVLDILSERGYQVILDIESKLIPHKLDPVTHEIIPREVRVFHFQIQFERPRIRN